MPERKELLASPRISSQRLFALKRLAEALDGQLLTLKEARRGAAFTAPQFAVIFNGHPGQAAQVIQIIEAILQKRYPGRFRATSRR
jgi:hypothetical protein